MINPSNRVISFFVSANTNNKQEELIKKNKSIKLNVVGVIVPNNATGIPNTTHILKILLPIIFPRSKSCSPFFEETIVVTSSGNEVPRAIIVSAINLSLNPIFVAIEEALFTTISLPNIIPASPIITKISDFIIL